MQDLAAQRTGRVMRQYAATLLVFSLALSALNASLPLASLRSGAPIPFDTAIFMAFWVGSGGVRVVLTLLVALVLWALSRQLDNHERPRDGIRIGIVVATIFPVFMVVLSALTVAPLDLVAWIFLCGLAAGLAFQTRDVWRRHSSEGTQSAPLSDSG